MSQSAEHGNCTHKKICSRSKCTPKIRSCTRTWYSCLVHPRESGVHPVHPSFFTLHARDLIEFCHALQTGSCLKLISPHPFAFQVMVNVSSVTLTSAHAHWLEFVTNAIMDHTKDVVSFVEVLVFLMLIIVKNVQYKKKM